MTEGLHFDHAELLRAVEREVSNSPAIWQGRKLLDNRESGDSRDVCPAGLVSRLRRLTGVAPLRVVRQIFNNALKMGRTS